MTSEQLVAQIEHLRVPEGQLALWALGQSGFLLKGGDTIALIDPYLSDSISENGGRARRFPIPIAPGELRNANVVFATHAHMDHADGATLGPLLAASAGATLVTSHDGGDVARKAGISADRIIVPRLGERVKTAGLAYTAVPAAHYEFEVDAEGHSRFMGFLIECNGVTVYHAGDTILFPELMDALKGKAIDLALLPINGRDFFRERNNIVGNLWPREAVDLASELEARVLIGMHNDLFETNRVSPATLFENLDRRAPFQRCHILQPGELYLYAG